MDEYSELCYINDLPYIDDREADELFDHYGQSDRPLKSLPIIQDRSGGFVHKIKYKGFWK